MRTILIYAMLLILPPTLKAQVAAGTGFQTATVTLTAAQVSSLHGSPVSIVSAPGVGQMLVPFSAIFNYKAGGASYAVAPDSHVALYMGSSSNEVTHVSAPRFLDQQTSQIFLAAGVGSIGASPQASLVNTSLMVDNDTSSEWTGGDGTLTITVYYTVLSLQ